MEIEIKIRNLYKIFGNNSQKFVSLVQKGMSKQELLDKHNHVLGLQNINLDIFKQNIHVIMGLSGSGKSTLVRHINRLIDPTSGIIEIDEQNITDLNKKDLRKFRQNKISMVFQNFGLLPHKTIYENVAFGLKIKKEDKNIIKEQTLKWIEKVGLKGTENHYPRQLSGGMQQRVGLARALVSNTKILLMDEAFSALDPLIRKDMQKMLLTIQQELHKTIIFITHDLEEALFLGNQISILKDGKLIQSAPPKDILLSPKDEYVANFVKEVNKFKFLKIEDLIESDLNPENYLEREILSVQIGHMIDTLMADLLQNNFKCIRVKNNQQKSIGYVSKEKIIEILKS